MFRNPALSRCLSRLVSRPTMATRSFAQRVHRPENVGLVASDIYFPTHYVAQEDLEKFDGVPAGKYSVGLGQSNMAFCTDREDIYSMSMSAVSNFMRKYNIPYSAIGRLEVATETILDHSKSIKTVLMQLFADSGNSDVEGVDTINACYAGTNALFNSVAWMESSSWDGRYAMVVSGDIAEYAKGPARPTGGAGVVVMLIGPNAPIVVDNVRASHMEHAYDFYKPDFSSPYPVVDGKYSQICYLRALDICYRNYTNKYKKTTGHDVDLNSFDYSIFHAPYNKLVQKAYARLLYNDFLRFPHRPEFSQVQHFRGLTPEESYTSADLDKAFVHLSKDDYKAKVSDTTLLPRQLGNMYTAALYAGLLSLVYTRHVHLANKSILMFSYGSGLASSMFSLRVRSDVESTQKIAQIRAITQLEERLRARIRSTPEALTQHMQIREEQHVAGAYDPAAPVDDMTEGSFYLVQKDKLGRRFYRAKTATA